MGPDPCSRARRRCGGTGAVGGPGPTGLREIPVIGAVRIRTGIGPDANPASRRPPPVGDGAGARFAVSARPALRGTKSAGPRARSRSREGNESPPRDAAEALDALLDPAGPVHPALRVQAADLRVRGRCGRGRGTACFGRGTAPAAPAAPGEAGEAGEAGPRIAARAPVLVEDGRLSWPEAGGVPPRGATPFGPRVPKATTLRSASPCPDSRCSHTTRRDMTRRSPAGAMTRSPRRGPPGCCAPGDTRVRGLKSSP